MTNSTMTRTTPNGTVRTYNASGAVLIPLTERFNGVLVARSQHALNHAQSDEPVILVLRRREVKRGSGSWPGVVVEAYSAWEDDAAFSCDGMIPGRREPFCLAVPDGERYDATARNVMGSLGAYCAVENSERIERAMREASEVLR